MSQERGCKFGERAITSFECTRHVNVDTGEPVRTIDPVVFGDVRAYVVLVGRRAEGAGEGRVFAQEVRGCARVQVLIWTRYTDTQYIFGYEKSNNVCNHKNISPNII